MESGGQSSGSSNSNDCGTGAQDIEMEDAGNTRKRCSTSNSDVEVKAKNARLSSENGEILDVLERDSVFGASSSQKTWFEMFMPNENKTIVKLDPSITTQELTRRLEHHFGDKYRVEAVLNVGVRKLEYEWSMRELATFGILTIVVEK